MLLVVGVSMRLQQKRSVDAHLESLIETQRVRLVGAESVEERRDAWNSMKALIGSRSPGRVRQMEMAKGLR